LNFAVVVAAVVVVDDDVVVVALFCDLDWEYACVLGEGWAGEGEKPDAGAADMGEGEVAARASRFCDRGRGEN
jgi:hypothetical protein